MIAELDRLSEKVELARAIIVKLKEDNRSLQAECADLKERLGRSEESGVRREEWQRLTERADGLTRERDELLREREQIVERVRGLLDRVEALEDLS